MEIFEMSATGPKCLHVCQLVTLLYTKLALSVIYPNI